MWRQQKLHIYIQSYRNGLYIKPFSSHQCLHDEFLIHTLLMLHMKCPWRQELYTYFTAWIIIFVNYNVRATVPSQSSYYIWRKVLQYVIFCRTPFTSMWRLRLAFFCSGSTNSIERLTKTKSYSGLCKIILLLNYGFLVVSQQLKLHLQMQWK